MPAATGAILGWLAAAPAVVAFTVWDLRERRIPNWLCLAFAIGAMVMLGNDLFSLLGSLLIGALVLLAGYPGGDVKACAVLALFLGAPAAAAVLCGAMAVNFVAWRYGVSSVPFFAYLAPSFGVTGIILAVLA